MKLRQQENQTFDKDQPLHLYAMKRNSKDH